MVAIIADLHDNLANFEKFALQTKVHRLTELWIAGDLGTPETFARVVQILALPMRYVAGNVETGHELAAYERVQEDRPDITWSASEPLTFTFAGQTTVLCHFPRLAEQFAKRDGPAIVVSGHTHRPHLARIDHTWHVNPGTLGGVFTPATYAILDTNQTIFTLHRLYN